MKRREFFVASAAAGLTVGGLMQQARGQAPGDQKQLLELRTYTCAESAKKAALLDYLQSAAIPAWNRLGIGPIGVLVANADDNGDARNVDPNILNQQVFVVLPHQGFDSVLTANRTLLADPEYVDAAKGYFGAPKSAPVFDSFSSALLLGFDACPRVEVPTMAEGRVLQLRIYESHQEERAAKKVGMFNEGGEIAVFRACGMNPVFFGEQIVGPLMPNLTYMLSFDSMEAKDAAWKKFLAHPDWIALKGDPQYKDTVSRITNIMLRPADGSQI